MKARKKDFANTSLATLILWAKRGDIPTLLERERIQYEIEQRQKELQQ